MIAEYLRVWTTPRRTRLRRLAKAYAVIVAASWIACAVSYFVEGSAFTATAARPLPTAVGSAGVYRDEVHLMFGHGGVFLVRQSVSAVQFIPISDGGSRGLAWDRVDNWMAPLPWPFGFVVRWGPSFGVRTWAVAAALTAGWLLFLGLLRFIVPEGHCVRCRYDLRGLDGSRCPECGKAPVPARS